MKPPVIGMIPARYQSKRYPGKLLVNIRGKSLLQRTYENAKRTSVFNELLIATDSKEIAAHVENFGATCIFTTSDCLTGSDRLAEAASQRTDLPSNAIIVNVQGDEPGIDPEAINSVVTLLEKNKQAVCATAVVRLTDKNEALSSSVVKCVLNSQGRALYFSRSLIPGNKEGTFSAETIYYKHLGLYAYRKEFLLNYASLPPTPLQLTECLEQLKILEHGYPIEVAIVEQDSLGIDTPEEMKKWEESQC